MSKRHTRDSTAPPPCVELVCQLSPPFTHACRAVGLGTSGALYVGVNLEFARLPLYNSVHAEQFLLVNALHHGERGIKRLAISAAPCGHCRQFYSELACAVRFQEIKHPLLLKKLSVSL